MCVYILWNDSPQKIFAVTKKGMEGAIKTKLE